MKKMKKLFQILLSGVLACSFALTVACSTDSTPAGDGDSSVPVGGLTGGYEQGDEAFIRNGASEYDIMVPAVANEEIDFASEELVYFMEMATGVKLDVVTDQNYDADGKYISIGRTSLYAQSGFTAPAEKYGASGYIVKSKGDNVFLAGSDSGYLHDYGAVYAVYHFLKGAIGLEIYALDCFDYQKTNDLKMPAYNVECVPDSDMVYFDYLQFDATYMLRMRNQNPNRDSYYAFLGHSQTGIGHMVPESVNHPEWFSGTGSGVETICYTKFDTTAYANTVIELIKKNPGHPFINLGITDMTTPCSCDECTAALAKYNTNQAGLQMIFLNAVVEKVYAEVQETAGVPLRIGTYAYEGVSAPPVKLVNGQYVPDCPEVVPHENLYIWWAPVTTNIAYSFQSPYNEMHANQYRGWCSLTDNIDYYGYNYERGSFTIASPSLVTFADNIEFFKSVGKKIHFFYEEGPIQGSSFVELIVYVQSKMAWDNSLNYQELAYDFIKHYYGPASQEMRQYYDLVTTWYASNQQAFAGTCLSSVWRPSAYPTDILNLWLNVLDGAEQTVLAEGPVDEALQRYLSRVHAEIFATNCNKLGTYKSVLTPSEKEAIAERIRPMFDEIRFIDLDPRKGSTFDEYYQSVIK